MAIPTDVTIPKPPRVTGNPQADLQAMTEYNFQLYGAVVVAGRVLQRLNSAASVAQATTSVSNPPTQAEVVAIRDTLNNLIAALG